MKTFALLSLASQVAAIWLAPQSFSNGSSAVWLAEDFLVTYNHHNVMFLRGCISTIRLSYFQ